MDNSDSISKFEENETALHYGFGALEHLTGTQAQAEAKRPEIERLFKEHSHVKENGQVVIEKAFFDNVHGRNRASARAFEAVLTETFEKKKAEVEAVGGGVAAAT